MKAPLTGIRVLAVEQYGAGPFGTQHLADLGAEVIKVENHTTGGDYARHLGPYFADGKKGDDRSVFYNSVNRGKKSITLDLARPEGRTAFARLATEADVVCNNLRGDVPAKLGLNYDALQTVNPAIVCGHCSAYGRTGERTKWPGYDYLMQAEAGYLHLTGEPDSPPTRMGLSIVDYMGGSYMAMAVIAGVMKARESGIGGDVDVNLFDTALFNLNYMAAWALNELEFEPARAPRSAHPSMVPTQLYKTADGWIFTMLNKPTFWPVLCEKLGHPDVAEDPRFATLADRLENRDILTGVLDAIFSTRTTAEWLEVLQGIVPVAPVQTPRQALESDFVRERGRVEALEMASGGTVDVLASPFGDSAVAGQTASSPMGADTDVVLSSAGFSPVEIADLRRNGLIA